MKNISSILLLILLTTFIACGQQPEKNSIKTTTDMKKTNDYWKDKLSPEAFRILREKGTEYPHTGEYNLHFETGVYSCMACKEPLFESQSKFSMILPFGQSQNVHRCTVLTLFYRLRLRKRSCFARTNFGFMK